MLCFRCYVARVNQALVELNANYYYKGRDTPDAKP